MHRDLHLKNIIYDKNKSEIKIIDFGIAKQLRERAFGASCAGAVDYRAPEMLNYQPYAYKIDVTINKNFILFIVLAMRINLIIIGKS